MLNRRGASTHLPRRRPCYRPPKEAQNTEISFCNGRNWLASVHHEYGVMQSRRSTRVNCAAQAENKRFFRRSTVSCANPSDSVYLTSTDHPVCNLAGSGAPCCVGDLHLSGLDRLWSKHRDRRPQRTHTQWFLPRHHLDTFIIPLATRAVRVALSNFSTQLRPQGQGFSPCLRQ